MRSRPSLLDHLRFQISRNAKNVVGMYLRRSLPCGCRFLIEQSPFNEWTLNPFNCSCDPISYHPTLLDHERLNVQRLRLQCRKDILPSWKCSPMVTVISGNNEFSQVCTSTSSFCINSIAQLISVCCAITDCQMQALRWWILPPTLCSYLTVNVVIITASNPYWASWSIAHLYRISTIILNCLPSI